MCVNLGDNWAWGQNELSTGSENTAANGGHAYGSGWVKGDGGYICPPSACYNGTPGTHITCQPPVTGPLRQCLNLGPGWSYGENQGSGGSENIAANGGHAYGNGWVLGDAAGGYLCPAYSCYNGTPGTHITCQSPAIIPPANSPPANPPSENPVCADTECRVESQGKGVCPEGLVGVACDWAGKDCPSKCANSGVNALLACGCIPAELAYGYVKSDGNCRDDNGQYPNWTPYTGKSIYELKKMCSANPNCQGLGYSKTGKVYGQLFGSDGSQAGSLVGTTVTKGDISTTAQGTDVNQYMCFIKKPPTTCGSMTPIPGLDAPSCPSDSYVLDPTKKCTGYYCTEKECCVPFGEKSYLCRDASVNCPIGYSSIASFNMSKGCGEDCLAQPRADWDKNSKVTYDETYCGCKCPLDESQNEVEGLSRCLPKNSNTGAGRVQYGGTDGDANCGSCSGRTNKEYCENVPNCYWGIPADPIPGICPAINSDGTGADNTHTPCGEGTCCPPEKPVCANGYCYPEGVDPAECHVGGGICNADIMSRDRIQYPAQNSSGSCATSSLSWNPSWAPGGSGCWWIGCSTYDDNSDACVNSTPGHGWCKWQDACNRVSPGTCPSLPSVGIRSCNKDSCCKKNPPCSSLTCPINTTMSDPNHLCKSLIGGACTTDECCVNNPVCTESICNAQSGQQLKGQNIICKGPICTNGECCDTRANCNSLTCPEEKYKPKAGNNFCAGTVCNVDDIATCCESQPKCSSYASTCLSNNGYLNPSASDKICPDGVCTHDVCCLNNQNCTAFSQSCSSKQHKINPAPTTPCLAKTCTPTECCAGNPKCSSQTCDWGKGLYPSGDDICQGENDCDNCCKTAETCSAWDNSEGFTSNNHYRPR